VGIDQSDGMEAVGTKAVPEREPQVRVPAGELELAPRRYADVLRRPSDRFPDNAELHMVPVTTLAIHPAAEGSSA
jgi:hypothetical protein